MLSIHGQDAEYILEPIAKQLVGSVSKRQAGKALRLAARRMLRLLALDAGLPLTVVQREASAVVKQLTR